MDSCIFCSIAQKQTPSEPILETDDVLVLNDIHPQAPVHMLVIPKKHVPEFLDMDENLLQKVYNVAQKVIKDQKLESYRLVNNGKKAALINHFHLHILGDVEKTRSL